MRVVVRVTRGGDPGVDSQGTTMHGVSVLVEGTMEVERVVFHSEKRGVREGRGSSRDPCNEDWREHGG